MRDDVVTITAALLIQQDGPTITGQVMTAAGRKWPVATINFGIAPVSDTWREEFRTLCKHLVEESLDTQRMQFNWVRPDETQALTAG